MNPAMLSAVLFLTAGADGVVDGNFAPNQSNSVLPGQVLPAPALPAPALPAPALPAPALPAPALPAPALPAPALPAPALPGLVLPGPNTPVTTTSTLTIPPSCNTDGRLPAVWVGAEYLMWYTEKAPLPVPLVTVNPNPAAITPNAAIGTPGTQIAYGGNGVNFGWASGMRFNAGVALSPDHRLFLEGSWLMLEKQSAGFSASSNGDGYPYLAQPIINTANGLNETELTSQPNPSGFAGTIQVASTTRLQGWDSNLGWEVYRSPTTRLVVLGGFRSLDLLDTTTIQTLNVKDVSGVAPGTPGSANLTFLGVLDTAGSTYLTEDRFRSSNVFYGGQLGARITHDFGRIFSISAQVKGALGTTEEIVTISGYSSQMAPGQPAFTVPGGVLTSASNMGRYSRSQFSVVPEGTLTLGAQLAPWCRATVGYNFLYWSEVARAGDAINNTVDRFVIPVDQHYGTGTGPAQPAYNFHNTDYWAQGITFGLHFSY